MSDYVLFLILGVGAGAIYAALALGLVMTYRASGFVNFALGAMGMYVTYVFVQLRKDGDLDLFVFRVSLGERLSLGPAIVVALLFAAGLGLLCYYAIFRFLQHAAPLARVVASVGLMILLQSLAERRFGTAIQAIPVILPNEPVNVLGAAIPRDRLYVLALVVAAAVLLRLLFQYTRFGLVTSAVAENEKASILLGFSPGRVAAANFVLATTLAGAIGILVSPITALDPVSLSLMIIPALGAALVARFSSFEVAVLAALAIGMLQSEITKIQQLGLSWFPETGISEGLPLVVIVIAMAIFGRKLPARHEVRAERLPFSPRPGRLLLATTIGVGLGAVAVLTFDPSYRLALIQSLVGMIICMSLVVATGYAGQISLAQAAFAGTAAYTLSLLTIDAGWPFPLPPLVGVVAAATLGAVMALPAIRVRGVHLAIATLAMGVFVEKFWFANPKYNGGFYRADIPSPEIGGLNLGIAGGDFAAFPRKEFAFFVLAGVVLVALVVAAIRRGSLGRRMLAIRANERAAAACGVNVVSTKIVAFTISAAIAGVSGCFFAYTTRQLDDFSFSSTASIGYLAIAYLGGITSIAGAVIGGTLVAGGLAFRVIDDLFGLGSYQTLISGIGLIVTAVLHPAGIAGAMRLTRQHLVHAVRSRRAGTVPVEESPEEAGS
jgi:branched-chain amino acid transport system permease protein